MLHAASPSQLLFLFAAEGFELTLTLNSRFLVRMPLLIDQLTGRELLSKKRPPLFVLAYTLRQIVRRAYVVGLLITEKHINVPHMYPSYSVGKLMLSAVEGELWIG